jgi:hypothetical protein
MQQPENGMDGASPRWESQERRRSMTARRFGEIVIRGAVAAALLWLPATGYGLYRGILQTDTLESFLATET